ncbi:MAG: hypothetical protein H0U49_00890 [Parachlamydiaceae bacterium]|nr:hypothetical protein [Parachlamydiaceae bacterium]
MIGPVSTTTQLVLDKVLKACSSKALSLAIDCLTSTKLGQEMSAQMNGQAPSMTLKEPAARMLILFLKGINDQDSIEKLHSKLLHLYHEALAAAQTEGDYKIENYIRCEYCQFVVQHCSELEEINTALAIQENLLDDINFGINIIDNSAYADSYEEQLRRHLLLIAKCHDVIINPDESTSKLMKSLATALSSILRTKLSKEKSQIARYYLAYLMMRVDNLDLFNLQQAYKIFKTLLTEQLQEPFASQVKFRLAELIRQSQNEDLKKDENGFKEMKELYFKIIYTDNDNQLKAKAQYALSQIFNRPELQHGYDLSLTRNALKQVILKSKPSSILFFIAHYQLGEFLILGLNFDDSDPIKGKEYLGIALQSNLLNDCVQIKLKLYSKMKTEGVAHIVATNSVEKNIPQRSELIEIRKILTMGVDSCIESSYQKMNRFYDNNYKFCIKNKNFNADVFRNLGDLLICLEEDNFSGSGRFTIPRDCITNFLEYINETLLPNLYAADNLVEKDPLLSFQLYQVNLSIVFSLITFMKTCIRENMVKKCYQEPKYLYSSQGVEELNGHFYKNYKVLHGSLNHQAFFALLEKPQNLGIFREMTEMTNVRMYKIFEKCQFEILPETTAVNGFELQPLKIPSKEMLAIVVAKSWALLKKLPLNPAYRSGIIQTLGMLRYQIKNLKVHEISVTNNQISQENLLINVSLSKFLYNLDRKLKYLIDPMDSIELNTCLFNLAGLLPKFEKFSLILEMARFNRDHVVNVSFTSEIQITNAYYLSISAYLKAFQLHPYTRNKIAILEELFSFGPKNPDEYVKMIQSIQKIGIDERNEYEVTMALYISCRIEYLLFSNQSFLAEELINRIKDSKLYFQNNKGFFDLFNEDLIKITTKTEGKYTFQLYLNDFEKRKRVLSKIGPYSPPDINLNFEIPTKTIKKTKQSMQPQQQKLEKKHRLNHSIKSQPVLRDTSVETDPFEYYESHSNMPSTTSIAKKAAAEQIQKIENKKILKEQRANAYSSSQISDKEIVPTTTQKAVLPSISISKDAKIIFDKLWIPHKGAINLNGEDFDPKNYKSEDLLTKNDILILLTAFNGSYVSGRGSHDKCIISSIDHTDRITIKGETIHISNFSTVESATMPLPLEKNKTPFLDGFLIIQLRSKLIQLGYTPLTVISK